VAITRAVKESSQLWTTTKRCALAGGTFPGLVGYTIVGFPFYLIKKAFWDLPRWLIAPASEAPESPPDADAPPSRNGPVSLP
jgi:hypothetical protein